MRQLADHVRRVGATPIGPRVPARAADGNPEAATAESTVDDAAQAASVEGDEGCGIPERVVAL